MPDTDVNHDIQPRQETPASGAILVGDRDIIDQETTHETDHSDVDTSPESEDESSEFSSNHMLKRFVRFEQRESVAIMILAGLAVVHALYLSRAISLPITFALLLALTLRPIVRHLRKYRIPNSFGAIIVVGFLVLASIIAVFRVVEPAQGWAADVPENVKLLKEKLAPLQEKFNGLSESSEVIQEAAAPGKIEPISVQIKQSSLSSNLAVMSKTGNIIGSMALVLSLTFFMLAYGDELTNSVLHLLSSYSEKNGLSV